MKEAFVRSGNAAQRGALLKLERERVEKRDAAFQCASMAKKTGPWGANCPCMIC